MANIDNDFVDISSSAEVKKVYESDIRTAPRRRKKKGLARRIVTLVLSIIMLVLGSGMVVYYNVLDTVNFKDFERDDQIVATDANGETTVTVRSGGSTLLSDDNVLNILLFGQDYRASETDYGRSDSMILLSIDNTHKKMKLTSFQRDTYVTIPGYGDNKINAAFSLGGEALSIYTVESNFGVHVDKYATVDFNSFRKIINVLGGVDMELNIQEIEYINAQIEVNHQEDKTSYLEYDPNKETQVVHLDGYQALWYARDRGEMNLGGNPDYSFDGDDWDRTQRQRKLIETIVKDLRTKADLEDLVEIVNEIGPLVTTNLKKGDITFLVSNLMTYLDYDIVEMTLPTQGAWRYGVTADGQSVIVIDDWNKVRTDLATFIYEDSVVTDATTAP